MRINTIRSADKLTIAVEGRLDSQTSPDLEKLVHESLDDVQQLGFDFTALQYISSAGLRVLLYAQKELQKPGSVRVTGCCEDVREIFEITGFSDILTVE